MTGGWRRELQDNARLRAGLLAIGGLLWLLALLELADGLDAARLERDRLADEVQRLQAVAGERAWPDFRDRVQQRLGDVRSLAWREESEGRMQAALQDWLRQQLAGAGIQPREVVVSVLSPATGATGDAAAAAGAALPPEARIVRARMVFDFQGERLHRFLAALPASRQWIWVSRLVVDNDRRRQVELEVEALFVLGVRGVA
jgi:hypothetical protein